MFDYLLINKDGSFEKHQRTTLNSSFSRPASPRVMSSHMQQQPQQSQSRKYNDFNPVCENEYFFAVIYESRAEHKDQQTIKEAIIAHAIEPISINFLKKI